MGASVTILQGIDWVGVLNNGTQRRSTKAASARARQQNRRIGVLSVADPSRQGECSPPPKKRKKPLAVRYGGGRDGGGGQELARTFLDNSYSRTFRC